MTVSYQYMSPGHPAMMNSTGNPYARFIAFRAAALTILACGWLAGCAEIKATPERIAAISAVKVSPTVPIPDKVFSNINNAAGFMFGAVGALIASMSEESKVPAKLQDFVTQKQLDVGDIVRTEFIKALQNDPHFANRLSDHADTTFQLEVRVYGVHQGTLNDKECNIALGVLARLIDSNGKVFWQDFEVDVDDQKPKAACVEFLKGPDLFREHYTHAAQRIAGSLLKKI